MQNDPINFVSRLNDSPLYSVHIGEYRVILDILHKKLIILVVRVGHPRNIYKKPQRQLWFSDIRINTGSSYFPFVRLAFVRYQPEPVEDNYISRVDRW